jgi:glutathione S-transferase
MNTPILYSFRRCPYAMRARLAIVASGIQVELREVVLRNKPQALLDVSPKATVPVLITEHEQLIDESIDIMRWALSHNDPQNWSITSDEQHFSLLNSLMKNNDGDFKHWLDRYKYADRFPEQPEHYYREHAEVTLQNLESLLSKQDCLLKDTYTFADIALLPFIRQFASVDTEWFKQAPYPKVRAWLQAFCESALFKRIMPKYPAWQHNDAITLFPSSC